MTSIIEPGTPLFTAIRDLVDSLVRGAYAELEVDGRIGRLTTDELRLAIEQYGQTLMTLPDEAALAISVYPYNEKPSMLAVDVPLWTIEEGRSDLTLSLTAKVTEQLIKVQIDDLHVL